MTAAKAKGERQLALVCLGLLAFAGAALLSLQLAFRRPADRIPRRSFTVEVPAANLMRPISPEEALRENADRSFSLRPDSPAAPFNFAGDSVARQRALECLTQAVYYEAGADGPDGERAVAQVVLNRVRHPGYPSSVCGVVYEGFDRQGCQFTFTCDGSLLRPPAATLWKQARQIALESLNGRVFAPVGHATHYHADYVLPYWADSLDKSAQIGQQIFYRLKGRFGDSAAFTQRYARYEPPPPPPPIAAPDLTQMTAEPADGATLPLSAPERDSPLIPDRAATPHEEEHELLADASRAVLIAGDGAAPAKRPRSGTPANPKGCTSKEDSGQLRPLSANDIRSAQSSDCR